MKEEKIKLLVCTWVGTTNTKNLKGNKHYPSLNSTPRIGSNILFVFVLKYF